MSSEATTSTPNEELVRRLFEEVFARGDLGAANQIVLPQFVLHDRELAPDPNKSGVGLIEDVITSTRDFFTLDPFKVTDFTVTVEEQLAAGDRVVTRFRVGGKLGDKLLEIRGMSISLISDGKIKECWSNWECGLLLKDLNLVIPLDPIRGKWPPPLKHN
jgi:ketosteroid isomerase-like protein